jgi:hypothetical protein
MTFGVRGCSGVLGDHAVGLLAFAAGLALTSGSLALLSAAAEPSVAAELAVLTVANVLATLLRFGVLRLRLFRLGRLGRLRRAGGAGEQSLAQQSGKGFVRETA